MSAIITNTFRRNSCQAFLDSVDDTYYIGLGKSDPWPDDIDGNREDDSVFEIPLPQSTAIDSNDVLDNLLALVRFKNKAKLIPNNPWKEGRKYKVYDPTDQLLFDLEGTDEDTNYPCFVNVNDRIYVCLGNKGFDPNNPSVITNRSYLPPSQQFDSYDVQIFNDGYIWAFVQNVATASVFNTHEFIPVQSKLDDIIDVDNVALAKEKSGGLIYSFKIPFGGNDFIFDPDNNSPVSNWQILLRGVDEEGNRIADVDLLSDNRFIVETNGTQITGIDYVGTNLIDDPLIGYERASIEFYDDGTFISEAAVIPLIAPIEGFGYDPVNTLPAFYAGIQAKFEGTVDGEAITDTFVRQVSLVQSPGRRVQDPDDDGAFYTDTEALDALDYIQLEDDWVSFPIAAGSIIYQEINGARVYVDKVDEVNKRIYYHYNSNVDVNYVPIDIEEAIVVDHINPALGNNTISDAFIKCIKYSEYIHGTGSVLFVDHREKISRNVDQTEDVKIVIQF